MHENGQPFSMAIRSVCLCFKDKMSPERRKSLMEHIFKLQEFCNSMVKLCIDGYEYAYLKAIVLFSPGTETPLLCLQRGRTLQRWLWVRLPEGHIETCLLCFVYHLFSHFCTFQIGSWACSPGEANIACIAQAWLELLAVLLSQIPKYWIADLYRHAQDICVSLKYLMMYRNWSPHPLQIGV